MYYINLLILIITLNKYIFLNISEESQLLIECMLQIAYYCCYSDRKKIYFLKIIIAENEETHGNKLNNIV